MAEQPPIRDGDGDGDAAAEDTAAEGLQRNKGGGEGPIREKGPHLSHPEVLLPNLKFNL